MSDARFVHLKIRHRTEEADKGLHIMRIAPGSPAPEFEVTTLKGRRLSLAELRGRPVWLAFFRYASCPLCNFRIHELITEWPQRFAAHDFEMVGVFQSPAERLAEMIERHTPPFHIVPDPEMNLYETYGLEAGGLKAFFGRGVIEAGRGSREAGFPSFTRADGPRSRMPADFLLDAMGGVQQAFYGRNIAEHIPFDDVSRFLAAQDRGAQPADEAAAKAPSHGL